ncbi:MAG TPA: glycosyltransferase, partial [Oscillatoriaceae cyanobacterium]
MTLSACLIVKNEAENLSRCLESLDGRAEEIVVVDTGSSDDTVAIAESFGAKVFHFPWCDDFSAARNFALEQATGDWILFIDADEELEVRDAAAFERRLSEAGAEAYSITQANLDDDGQIVSEVQALRLWPNTPGIRFSGRVHENIGPALEQQGWRCVEIDAIRLRHRGYQSAYALAKLERNTRLARLELAVNPDSPDAWFHLARGLYSLGRHEEAQAARERVEAFHAQNPHPFLKRYVEILALADVRPMRLSACLIVKDEAENLSHCLESLKGWVDEIVVVDTGSSDDTVAIAESFGAKVSHFAWCDDFSAARNFALEQATGDWILVIDADEELVVDQPDALTRAMAAEASAYAVQIENVGESGAIASHFAPLRLVRRGPGIAFSGRLHEDLSPSVRACGWTVVPLGGARLRHYGYTNEMLQKLDKRARNARLARVMTDEHPDDPNAWYQLARSLWLNGEREGTMQAIARLEALAEAGARLDPIRERTFLLLSAWAYGADNAFARALEVLDAGLERYPRYPEFLFERGRVHLEMRNQDAALVDFEACLQAPREGWESTVRAGVTGYLAHVELVALHARRDRLDLARPHLLAASRDPSCPPAEALRLGQLALALPMPTPAPRLSACLIVKDEAENLPRCLRSLEGWVDEIIVVDTGSSDDTVAIAASFGAKVSHFAWCDDFSAARNFALEQATGDWILVIDADEELVVENPEAFRALGDDRRCWGYSLRQANASDDGATELNAHMIRLLRREAKVRFEGRLHEQAIPSSGEWTAEHTDCAWLKHRGYSRASLEGRDKAARNVRLARLAVEDAPDAPAAWVHLARSLTFADQLDEARTAYARVETLLTGNPAADETLWFLQLNGRFELAVRQARFDEAEGLLEAGLQRKPGFPEFLFERGKLRYNRGDLRGAIADFEACLTSTDTHEEMTQSGVTDALPREALAQIAARHPELFVKGPARTLSACLIVKDEAENLPRCLKSLEGWVDEIIVVDTGSSDDTVAIAAS